MPSSSGGSLRSLIAWHDDKRIPIACSVHIVRECCAHLAVLDRAPPVVFEGRIVPRDISPETILVSQHGEVSLVSFEIEEMKRRMVTAAPFDRFSYLSPEAANGDVHDRRTDVFVLGILLWEMLTGYRLFVGKTDYQTVELVREARVPSITARNPEVNLELDAVVRKALARDPDLRHQSCAELGDVLAQYLASRQIAMSSRDIAALVREMYRHAERLPN